MRFRKTLVLIGALCLLAVPASLAAATDGHPVAFAAAAIQWTIPLPNVFDVAVGNKLAYAATKSSDGSASGYFLYYQTVNGVTFRYSGRVTCMGVYDGGARAKIGGLVTGSTDPDITVGSYGWFQAFDNGWSPAHPDQSTLLGFGDAAANQAFCASPNTPRFGPWDVQGQIVIRSAG